MYVGSRSLHPKLAYKINLVYNQGSQQAIIWDKNPFGLINWPRQLKL